MTRKFVLGIIMLLTTGALADAQAVPIAIHNCQELQNINNNKSGNYILANDIDCSETKTWNTGRGLIPIGPFTGTLDGQNFTIKDLYINTVGINPPHILDPLAVTGLFNQMKAAQIKNIRLVNVKIDGAQETNSHATGGVAGSMDNRSRLTKVFVDGRITGKVTGGIVGALNDGEVEFSSSNVEVYGISAGGITGTMGGFNLQPRINQSFSKGIIYGRYRAGGLVGITFSNQIVDSYSAATVTYEPGSTFGEHYGGLIGFLISSIGLPGPASNIINSYAVGHVQPHPKALGGVGSSIGGGLIGLFNITPTVNSVVNSYWDRTSTGQNTSSKNLGIAKSTIEMQTASTFASWDNTIWAVCEGDNIQPDYPHLKWENSPCFEKLLQTTLEDTLTINSNRFGSSVALDSNILAISDSAFNQQINLNPGNNIVHFYQRQNNAWVEQYRARPDVSDTNSTFGRLLAVKGNGIIDRVAIVSEKLFEASSIYIYERSSNHRTGNTWNKVGSILLNHIDPIVGITMSLGSDSFLSSNKLAIAYTNKIEIYEEASPYRSNGVGDWRLMGNFALPIEPGNDHGRFGSVAFDDSNKLFIGLPQDNPLGISKSAVYIFQGNTDVVGTQWQKIQELTSDQLGFGDSLAVSGKSLVISSRAVGDKQGKGVFSYQYNDSARQFEFLQKLSLSPESLKKSVALKDATLAVLLQDNVQSPNDDTVQFRQSVAVFKFINNEWTKAYTLPSNLPFKSPTTETGLSFSVGKNSDIVIGDARAIPVGSSYTGKVTLYSSSTSRNTLSLITEDVVGSGHGRVISAPEGINCNLGSLQYEPYDPGQPQPVENCSFSFNTGTEVTLTAIPDNDSVFGGFAPVPAREGKRCISSGSEENCQVTMDTDVYFRPIFILKTNADLAVTSLIATPINAVVGDKINLALTIRNNGTGVSSNPFVNINISRSTENSSTNTNVWSHGCELFFAALQPGQEWSVNTATSCGDIIPPTAGDYRVSAKVQSYGEVLNADNERSYIYTVNPKITSDDLTTVCYRCRTIKIPGYLQSRYLAKGAKYGACTATDTCS